MENIIDENNYEELLKEKEKIIDKLNLKIENMKTCIKNLHNVKKELENNRNVDKQIIQ